MKKNFIAAVLAGAVMISGLSVSVMADKEKTFVYETTGYSEEIGDAGLNPHDNYSGWSALRYGEGEMLFKYNDNMEVEPWLATDYEFVDDTTVKITLRDGVKFSSGRTMDAQAVKECLENLVKVHDRAPSDMKIDYIDADGLTLTIYTTEPCPAIINYLGDPYGAIIDMEYGVQGEGGNAVHDTEVHRLGAAAHVRVVEIRQTIGLGTGFAVGTLTGPVAGRTNRTHGVEHAFDGIRVGERHTEGLAQLTRLGGDAQATCQTGQRHGRLIGRADDLHERVLAQIGKNTPGHERTPPRGTNLRDLALHDLRRQATDRPVTVD